MKKISAIKVSFISSHRITITSLLEDADRTIVHDF